MTIRPTRLPAPRALLATALFLAAAGAQAMTVTYQCTGRRILTAELSPRVGQLHFEGHDWTVARVPGGKGARYLDKKAGVEVLTRERTMSFTHDGETLQCFLFSDALPGDAPQIRAN